MYYLSYENSIELYSQQAIPNTALLTLNCYMYNDYEEKKNVKIKLKMFPV